VEAGARRAGNRCFQTRRCRKLGRCYIPVIGGVFTEKKGLDQPSERFPLPITTFSAKEQSNFIGVELLVEDPIRTNRLSHPVQ
jgi:hypothetical protein